MGVLAGYYANSNYKVSRNAFLLRLFGTLLFFFMFIWQGVERWQIAAEQEILTKVLLPDLLLFFSANLGWYYLVKKLEQRKLLGRRIIQVPYESLVQRLIEIVQALPLTVLLIMLSAVSKSSVWQLVMIMGAVQWISIARLLKVELQSVRNSDYFIALRGLGLRDQQIIFYKALPNFLPMLVTAFMLGFAQCVLAEAGLSFLGIGIPGDTVTWGTLLSAAKENWNAWWLIVFPGLSLASVLIALNGLFKK
jgi:peptide/nickel transport system permease protein